MSDRWPRGITGVGRGDKLGRSNAGGCRCLAARGAEAVVADMADQSGLTKPLAGASGFLAIHPFDLGAEDSDEQGAAMRNRCSVRCVDRTGRMVFLSSGRAGATEGVGPVIEVHDSKHALASTTSQFTAQRSQHSQEKATDVPFRSRRRCVSGGRR